MGDLSVVRPAALLKVLEATPRAQREGWCGLTVAGLRLCRLCRVRAGGDEGEAEDGMRRLRPTSAISASAASAFAASAFAWATLHSKYASTSNRMGLSSPHHHKRRYGEHTAIIVAN